MEGSEKCKSARFTLCFTVWRKKDLLCLDGEMKNATSEEVQDGVITSSQVLGSSKWIHSDHSGRVYSIGSPFEEIETMQPSEHLPSEETNRSINPHIPPMRSSVPPASLRNLPLLGGHVPPASLSNLPLPRGMPLPPSGLPTLPAGMPSLPNDLPSLKGVEVSQMPLSLGLELGMRFYLEAQQTLEEPEQAEELLIAERKKLELLEETSRLHKRFRKYKRSDPAETWTSRWVASSIAYLFPENSREEWLGDLYEVNREMLHKEYPRWWVNSITALRTLILVISALQIKLSDLLTFKINSTK